MTALRSIIPCICLFLSAILSTALADTGDECWSDLFSHAADLNGAIYASVLYDGDVIVAGDFTYAGNVALDHVARWDGAGWRPLGNGIPDTYRIYALAVFEGDLYADQWRWDETAWEEAFVPDTRVLCLAVHEDRLVVGGQFSTIDAAAFPHLFAWTGSQAEDLGGGCDGFVRALLSHDGSLYVGGTFDAAGAVPVSNVAAWNGTTWSDLGGGVSGEQMRCCDDYGAPAYFAPLVETICAMDGDIYVGGQFALAGGDSISALARWDGTDWSAEEDLQLGDMTEHSSMDSWEDFPPYVRALAVSPQGHLVAGGRFTVPGGYPGVGLVCREDQDWDLLGGGLYSGSSYSPLYDVKSLLSIPGGLIVGGSFLHVGDEVAARYGAIWTGQDWFPLNTEFGFGTDGHVFTTLIHQGELIVGGSFTRAGYLPVVSLARFDGDAWSPLGSSGIDGTLPTVRALAEFDDDLVIGGRFTSVDGIDALNVARWDGAAWRPMGEGLGCEEIAALCVHDGTLFAAGGSRLYPYPDYDLYSKQIFDPSYLYVWTGISWDPLAATNEDLGGAIRALASYDGRLVLAGSFTTVDDLPMEGLATWDGTSFAELGGGLRTHVRCLEVGADGLYAGGWITEGWTPADCVQRWDGSAWHVLGTMPGSSYLNGVYDLMLRGDRLYAAGQFESVSDVPARGVAVLEDGVWRALGSGVSETATALEWYDGALYVGGQLDEAGGMTVGGLARWDGEIVPLDDPNLPEDPSSPPTTLRVVSARPNPFNPRVEIVYTVDRPQALRVSVCDSRGRRLAVLAEGPHKAATYTAAWDGRALSQRALPSGIYFVELRGERSRDTMKITLIR